MAFVNMTKPAQGTATKKSLIDTIIDNLMELFGVSSAADYQLPNQTFERDTDSDGVPDGWVWTSTGGTLAIDATAAGTFHGGKAVKITGTGGASGGYLTTRDFLPASPGRNYTFRVAMKCSLATVSAKIDVLFYDINQTLVSTVTAYTNAATNPVAYTHKFFSVDTPSSAHYYKLRLYGVNSATNGSTYYDDCGQVDEDMSRVPYGAQKFTSSGSLTVPTYVTRVKLRCWGGGGGGGGKGGVGGQAGSGGGGGEYAETIATVTPGGTLNVIVGAGGSAGASGSNGGNGGDSYVTLGGSTLALANGGVGGLGGAAGFGGGNGGSGGTGSILFAGENGEDAVGTSVNGRGGIGGAPMFQLSGLMVGNGGTGGEGASSLVVAVAGGQGCVIIEW